MKLTALVLSFYFILISSQPLVVGVVKVTDICNVEVSQKCDGSKKCHSEREPKGDTGKKENSCPVCCCNVFQSAFCCGTLIEESVFGIVLHSKSANLFPKADSVLPSSYSSDCWQPPELI